MEICPRCGSKITEPIKTWSIVDSPNKKGERFKLTLGLFICPKCKKRFQKAIYKEKFRATLKNMVKEIKGIERKLVHTLGDLKEKIEKLKSEKTELLQEIESLKRAGEEKANTLEKEVKSLREEVKSLKEIIDDLE